MEAQNEKGFSVITDAAESVGGTNAAMRPMQLMLAGLGSCSSIDVIHMLKKQRQHLEDIRIVVTADREKDKVPSLFTKVHVHFILKGDLNENKVKRAVDLSMEKYCSVAKIMEKTAEITWSYVVERETLA